MPILLAAQALRDRVENIIKNIELIESEKWLLAQTKKNYYYRSTLFVVGNFFGWVQILRQTIVYLDFSTTKETKKFEGFLNIIERSFTHPSLFGKSKTGIPKLSKDKWVYKYILRSVGASMITHDEQGYKIIDYITFYKFYDHSEGDEFKNWFFYLEEMFKNLKANDVRFKRVIAIHTTLNAFVDYLDPKHLQTEKNPYYWELLSEQERQILQKMVAGV